MARQRTTPLFVLPLLALGACDVLGPGDDGNTRVVASQATFEGIEASLVPSAEASATGGHDYYHKPGVVLALVEDLGVTITAVQALPVDSAGRPQPRLWETLTLSSPVTVNLLDLPSDSAKAKELFQGDLPPGQYTGLRFLVSEVQLRLAAPLTIGRFTFPADSALDVFVPQPWVPVPGATFTVSADSVSSVEVFFDANASIGQLTVGPGGVLQFKPVFRGRWWRWAPVIPAPPVDSTAS